MIYPFLRRNLDILFVGLNPANTSSKKEHYFSTNQSFWNQLYESGLIKEHIDKDVADNVVFGSSSINHHNYEYGITDLVNYLAESNSSIVKPTLKNCIRLQEDIMLYKPRIVVLLHSKVVKCFVNEYLKKNITKGYAGKLLDNCNTVFYYVPFPHGNSICTNIKVAIYADIKKTLDNDTL